MAWHTLGEALRLTGKSRSQLYRDMRSGRVSYRTGKNDRREFETSELIRAYGELTPDETAKRHRKGQTEKTPDQQLEAIRQQLADLQHSVTLMLEDKQARETAHRQREEEREQMQKEITRLREALDQEKNRGFLSRLFRNGGAGAARR
ncbi:TPA_asm: entry exclusion protein 1 [Salmonella enterica subsp. enterica serovar Typhimurium]|nr:entry exclusion protein 1 [Salmonella enterica subsp. enterica serovar Typhimurium]